MFDFNSFNLMTEARLEAFSRTSNSDEEKNPTYRESVKCKVFLGFTSNLISSGNDIPVFCPGLTDGSLGDMLYFHSFRNPGLVVDIVQDIRAMNGEAVHANPRKTGMIILGGGLPKHHICNANMMRNGADYAVFINYTAQEFDGSDSGARPDEAVSWGKIRASAKSVKVNTQVFSLIDVFL
ncbi:putative deoxyhypusine synthase [Helianthus annuus]|uniref:Deoxyhypusine synthase n=2 Tax=Helianthus annuus TaxID=4232 RepID=A0A9K3JBY0_HELAN|nr:putative deoxyhypusine synthase [Helianthus annuus]KAJ0933302.1 Deoxyhypusine synthase [Helianthus annuus]